ncbi:hypothetical protein K435DRAFT_968969 [Dendrothele bispora CBS 962.96]|uniref:C2H2-type domain-containing protein n=1 Tax=Dendrothele bispora (strain CBS 962.96) TaxID=1314807 RepID=A0A4S8LKY4_DENBC|nr:hypothetical protein K435DRAFT_968969 [Dendrothele bispora CBS 962.96]
MSTIDTNNPENVHDIQPIPPSSSNAPSFTFPSQPPFSNSFQSDQTSNNSPMFGGDSDYVSVPIDTTAAISQGEPAVIHERIASQALIDVATRRRHWDNQGQKLYRCDRCSQDFTAKHNLRNHINSHLGIKKHECTCGQAFGTKHVLTRHQKTCNGVTKRKVEPGSPSQSFPQSNSGF